MNVFYKQTRNSFSAAITIENLQDVKYLTEALEVMNRKEEKINEDQPKKRLYAMRKLHGIGKRCNMDHKKLHNLSMAIFGHGLSLCGPDKLNELTSFVNYLSAK